MKATASINAYHCAACDVDGMADATGHVCWACGSAAHLHQQSPWHGTANSAETVVVPDECVVSVRRWPRG